MEKEGKKTKKKEVTKKTEGDEDAETLINMVKIASDGDPLWLSKAREFLKMSQEERDEKSKKMIRFLIDIYKSQGGLEALSAFSDVMNTPHGFICFLNIWRPEFRATMMRLLASLVQMVQRLK